MKFNNKRGGGYSASLSAQIVDSSKPIHSLSIELEAQMKFEDGKRTKEIQAYKAWFSQEGLTPLKPVKFLITSTSVLKTSRRLDNGR